MLVREIPGQERLDVFRSSSACCRTAFQVPSQPPSWIEFPTGQRGQERKHRRRQPSAPQGTRSANGGGFERIKQLVAAVGPAPLLRLAAEKLCLEAPDLPLGLTQFLGQLLVTLHRVCMPALPIAHFAAKFTDLPPHLPQFPLQALQGRAVCAGKSRLLPLNRQTHKRGTHGATL